MKKLLTLFVLIIASIIFEQKSFAENIKFVQVTDAHFKSHEPYRSDVLQATVNTINKKSLVATYPHLNKSHATKLSFNRQLLMLMTILTQTFFTFVRRHLMSLMLLSVRHNVNN